MTFRLEGGGVLSASRYWFEESVWLYCSELHVESLSTLGGGSVVYGDNGSSWVLVGVEVLGGGLYGYVFYPQGFLALSGVMSRPVCGVYGLDGVCDCLGLPFLSMVPVGDFVRHQWVLGSLRGVRLFDSLRDGSGCSGGGCSTFRYDGSGCFVYSDIHGLVRGSWDVGSLFGFEGRGSGAIGLSSAGEFVSSGVLDVCFDSDWGVGAYSRLVFNDVGIVGGYKSYLSNSELVSYREWCFRNRYWRGYYRGVVEHFVGCGLLWGSLSCGCLCECGGNRYVCVGWRGLPVEGGDLSIDVIRVV